MSNEAWLIGRGMDTSKKIFLATRILVLDFELLIDVRIAIHAEHTTWTIPYKTYMVPFTIGNYCL